MWDGYVRLTHLPTGLTAHADFGRSTVKRRDACKSVLRGKLWHLEHGADAQTPTEAQRAIAARLLQTR